MQQRRHATERCSTSFTWISDITPLLKGLQLMCWAANVIRLETLTVDNIIKVRQSKDKVSFTSNKKNKMYAVCWNSFSSWNNIPLKRGISVFCWHRGLWTRLALTFAFTSWVTLIVSVHLQRRNKALHSDWDFSSLIGNSYEGSWD